MQFVYFRLQRVYCLCNNIEKSWLGSAIAAACWLLLVDGTDALIGYTCHKSVADVVALNIVDLVCHRRRHWFIWCEGAIVDHSVLVCLSVCHSRWIFTADAVLLVYYHSCSWFVSLFLLRVPTHLENWETHGIFLLTWKTHGILLLTWNFWHDKSIHASFDIIISVVHKKLICVRRNIQWSCVNASGLSILLQAHGKQSTVHIDNLFCRTSTIHICLVHWTMVAFTSNKFW